MESREVTHTGKDDEQVITELCNPTSEWKSVSTGEAIKQIDDRTHKYFVAAGDQEVVIQVIDDEAKLEGKYLRTVRDETETNNLDDLPDC